MSWYKVEISAHQQDFGAHEKLKEQFEKIFILLQTRQEMALFSTGWSTSDKFNIYFTPACPSHPAIKSLMDSYGAKPCDEPTRETESELGLLVGDLSRWRNFIWSPDIS